MGRALGRWARRREGRGASLKLHRVPGPDASLRLRHPFLVGEWVRLQGLLSSQELNGRRGKIVRVLHAGERFGVAIAGRARPVAVKFVNLRREAASEAQPVCRSEQALACVEASRWRPAERADIYKDPRGYSAERCSAATRMHRGATRVRPGHSTGQAKAEGAAGKVSFTISVEGVRWPAVPLLGHVARRPVASLCSDGLGQELLRAALQCGPR